MERRWHFTDGDILDDDGVSLDEHLRRRREARRVTPPRRFGLGSLIRIAIVFALLAAWILAVRALTADHTTRVVLGMTGGAWSGLAILEVLG